MYVFSLNAFPCHCFYIFRYFPLFYIFALGCTWIHWGCSFDCWGCTYNFLHLGSYICVCHALILIGRVRDNWQCAVHDKRPSQRRSGLICRLVLATDMYVWYFFNLQSSLTSRVLKMAGGREKPTTTSVGRRASQTIPTAFCR